jgi:hypothetical protein
MNTNQAIYRESGIAGITAGDPRGQYAVDFQIRRNNSTKIASGDYSVICGGLNNTAHSERTFIGNGIDNIVNGPEGFIGSGSDNVNNGIAGFIGNGENNHVMMFYNTIVNGVNNETDGEYSFIGGGNDNDAKSFYSYVGNGDFNQANTSYYATIVNGSNNTASGNKSFIANGSSNQVTSRNGFIGNGHNNTVSGLYSFIGNGQDNSVTADGASIIGGMSVLADKYGQMAFGSGTFMPSNIGEAQTSVFVLRNITTDSTTSDTLYLNGTSALMTLNDQDFWTFRVLVVGGSDDHTNYASYAVTGFIHRNGATTTIAGVTKTTITETSAGYDVSVVADNTNNALIIIVTGDATNTMHWVARVEVSQLIY